MTETAAPVHFDPAMERPEDNEAKTFADLESNMRTVRETTFKDGGQPLRSVHAKSHGILRGTLTVLDGLPPHLAQGLFAKAGSYPMVMRLSTIPGDMLDDSVSTPRGLAIKVLGVAGPRLPGSEADTTQDFILVNGPAFSAPTAAKFLGNLKLLTPTTDKVEGLKETVSRVARGAEAALEAVGLKSTLVTTLGGQPATHILGETFYSQTPFLFGPYVAKFAVAPVSPNLTALTGQAVDVNGKPDALREAVIEQLGAHGAEWELRVQLNTNPDAMPIEDAAVAWPEDQSPYIAVARVAAPAQNAWSMQNVNDVDHCMSFSVWHGLAAHRPLGSVNRARRDTYRASAAFRGQHYGCPMHEPKPG